jgi:hypothetical protein
MKKFNPKAPNTARTIATAVNMIMSIEYPDILLLASLVESYLEEVTHYSKSSVRTEVFCRNMRL